jgi:Domain of unknown function (DUF1905)
MMECDRRFEVTARVWLWRPAKPSAASWHFVTVEGQTAAEIRYAALGQTAGFGSIKVAATIGGTRWRTSLFPERESGNLVLPLKVEVRRRENIAAGDTVTVILDLQDRV